MVFIGSEPITKNVGHKNPMNKWVDLSREVFQFRYCASKMDCGEVVHLPPTPLGLA
jgi:hypothetical protein